jgi:hypothetical protein
MEKKNEMTTSDWNALSDDAKQKLMHAAYEHKVEIEIGAEKYPVELTVEGKFALHPRGLLSLIRSW